MRACSTWARAPASSARASPKLLPEAQVLGVELLPASVEHARERHAALAPRLKFETGDAFHLAQPDNTFDLVANRHMVQSVPHVDRILAELVRVTKPGGRVHVLAEDYSMLHMMSGPLDPGRFLAQGTGGILRCAPAPIRASAAAPGR